MPATFVEYYRCPEDVGSLDANGTPSSDEGYFRFDDVVCYGRCNGATPSRAVGDGTHNFPLEPATGNGIAGLPFQLSEVVTNLRQERYLANRRSTDGDIVRRLYYLARPLLPVPVRKHLQKVWLAGWQRIAFPEWPIDVSVDRLMDATMTLALKRVDRARLPFIWFWPDGAPACAILTHDVEATAGRDFSSDLMDIDDQYGLKASFQIVPEGRYSGVEALCARVRSRGFEVNVHDLNHDGHLFQDRRRFEERVARVNEYGRAFESRGFRAAAMYRNQDWFDRLEYAYDMSVPNAAHLEPQRGGCCTVMPYFVGGLVELPLTTTQDYSLFHILNQYSAALWTVEIDRIIARHGLITLLTHPDYLIDPRAQAVYRELLQHVARLRAAGRVWFALPGQVERWWRLRDRLRIVRDGDSWRVEGAGAERARIAYAVLEDDRVAYTF
jgi:hypothetical protein